MRTMILAIVIVMLASIGWAADEPVTVNSLLQATEDFASFSAVDKSVGGLRGITEVRIMVQLNDPDNLFTTQGWENQLLVGLRSKLPKLKVVLSEESTTPYYVNLNGIIAPSESKSGYKYGYSVKINLSVIRLSVVPGPTRESQPIAAYTELWKKGWLGLASSDTAKSYLKETIDDMITKLAADYYKQNAGEQPVKQEIYIDWPNSSPLFSLLDIINKFHKQVIKKSINELESVGFCAYAVSLLIAIGKTSVEPLIMALGNESIVARIVAISALEQIGDKRAIPALEKIAKEDNDETVRESAMETLVKLRKQDSSIIHNAVKDAQEKLRKEVK